MSKFPRIQEGRSNSSITFVGSDSVETYSYSVPGNHNVLKDNPISFNPSEIAVGISKAFNPTNPYLFSHEAASDPSGI